MSDKLELVSVDRGGFLNIASTKDLDGGMEQVDGENPLRNLLGTGWAAQRVLLDLAKTEHLDSNAIGWLIRSHNTFRTHQGQLVVHSVSPRVRQVFKMLNVTSVLRMADDQASGRALLTGAVQ